MSETFDVFDPTMKKKKKKTKKEVEEEAPQEVPTAEADAGAEEGAAGETAEVFDPTMKKKKKKTKKVDFNEDAEDDTPLEAQQIDADARDDVVFAEPAAITEVSGDMPWLGSDREYKYEELLGRVFGILTEHHPELSGEKRRHVMRPPQVAREGTKKTVFINFLEICRTMHRQQDHVYQFLLAELGTSGSIDGNNRLVLKGRFLPKGIENVLRRYIGEYVTCHSCKSPDTKLDKENRLYFLRCRSCNASRSVAPIKTGFQAQVGKRSKTKAVA